MYMSILPLLTFCDFDLLFYVIMLILFLFIVAIILFTIFLFAFNLYTGLFT